MVADVPAPELQLDDLIRRADDGRGPGEIDVSFVLTDLKNEIKVAYSGILPDLFREGQGIIAHGKLGDDGVFHADEVLAKHDEAYTPPSDANASSNRPSEPIRMTLPLPADRIWSPNALPFGGSCHGMYTSCVSRGIFAISAEKSDCCWLTPSRETDTPAAFSTFSTASARPVL